MAAGRSLLPTLFFLLGFAFFVLGLEQAFPVFVDTAANHVNGNLVIYCFRDRRWGITILYALVLLFLAWRYHRYRSLGSIKPLLIGLAVIIIQLVYLGTYLHDDRRIYQSPKQNPYARPPLWWETSEYLGRFILDPLFVTRIILFLASIALVAPLVLSKRHLFFNLFRRKPEPGICHSCGYNLYGNQSGICPECGTPVHKNPYEELIREAYAASGRKVDEVRGTAFSHWRWVLAAVILLTLTCGLWRVLVWHRSFAPPGNYDLTARLWIGVQPETGDISFWPIVINQGHDDIREWTYNLRLDINGRFAAEMPKGHRFPARSFAFPHFSVISSERSPGSYRYRWIIDSENRVNETNEDNNIIEGTIVVPPRQPATPGESGLMTKGDEKYYRDPNAWAEAQIADLINQGLSPPPRR